MHAFTLPSPQPLAPYFQAAGCRAPVLLGVDLQFIALLDSYRASGGLARTQETLELFLRRGGPDLAEVARWMAQREVLVSNYAGVLDAARADRFVALG
jgi:hypothetical protein